MWSDRPDRNRYYDWTLSGQDAEKNGGSIIDRFVTSKDTLLDSEIFVTNGGKDYIPHTNHRSIVARIIHNALGGGYTIFSHVPATSTKRRIKYPSRLESHRREKFRVTFDDRAKAAGLFDICVNDDESFLKLYDGITDVLIPTAEEAYGRVSRFKRHDQLVTNPKIQKALATVRACGGAM